MSLRRGIWNSKVSSYSLRGLLWAGGATASNKVLEALVGRFANNKQISLEGYLMSMSRLHLAHGELRMYNFYKKMINSDSFKFIPERYHSLDAKAKANPLTLEEVNNFIFTYIIVNFILLFSISDDTYDNLFLKSLL